MTKVRADGDDLEFNFIGCPEEDVIDLDQQQVLAGGTRCDFVVLLPIDPYLLIEVKDPCQANADPARRKIFLRDLMINPDDPMNTKLLKKAEATVAFVQSAWPTSQRLLYLVVFGMECLIDDVLFDRSILGPMQLSLLRRIKSHPALGATVEKVRLLSVSSWNRALPHYPLRRVSAGATP